MRILKLEIDSLGSDDDRRRWYQLGARCQEMTNRIWRLWLVHHAAAGSERLIREYLNALAAWRERKGAKADKPKLGIQAVSNELLNSIYHDLSANFPDVNKRTLTLLLNQVRGKIIHRKAAYGPLSGWMTILLDKENIPSSTKPVPIPFDKANGFLSENGDRITLTLRASRTENEKGKGVSVIDHLLLRTWGKAARYSATAFKIVVGEIKFAGSSLWYDARKRRWFALLAYEQPAKEKPALDEKKTLFVRAAQRYPLQVRVGGKSEQLSYRGSPVTGEPIAHKRRVVLEQRWSRQENYRITATATKGHGRERALLPEFKLKQSWNHFAKTWNQTIAHRLIDIACRRQCATIVLFDAEDCFLKSAGHVRGRNDSTTWPWFQLEKILADAAAERSIRLQFRRRRNAKANAANVSA